MARGRAPASRAPGAHAAAHRPVHETYLRLLAQDPGWQNREHLLAVASRLMRRVLVDHARRRATLKRGGLRVTLAEGLAAVPPAEAELLDLEAALEELAAVDERQVQLVELRFFGGVTIEEAARASRSRSPPPTATGLWPSRGSIAG